MKLNPQQKAVYDYLKERDATIVELRNALFIAKPCMRISEINRKYPKTIVTKYKKNNGEHVKGITTPLTKKVSQIEIVNGVAVETMKEVLV